MKVPDNLKEVLTSFCEEESKSMREYDKALGLVADALSQEHRRLTSTDEGVSCKSELAQLAYDFIIRVYFRGRVPFKYEIDDYLFAKRVRTVLTSALREQAGIHGLGQLYNDELSEMRIRLMAQADICELLESRVGAKTKERLVSMRST